MSNTQNVVLPPFAMNNYLRAALDSGPFSETVERMDLREAPDETIVIERRISSLYPFSSESLGLMETIDYLAAALNAIYEKKGKDHKFSEPALFFRPTDEIIYPVIGFKIFIKKKQTKDN